MNRLATQFIPSCAWLLLAHILFTPSVLRAQNPELAPADLKYTRAAFTHNHLVARVELEVERDKYVRYQYDRYPDLVRIKTDNGTTFARLKAKAWLKSGDWGETGIPVDATKAAELDTDAKIAELPLQDGRGLDVTQGDTVWKLVDRVEDGASEYLTYEKSRERPRVGGFYPRYTFVKFKGDSDGKLLLSRYSGQLRAEGRLVPIEARYDLMIPLPPGSVKFETAPNANKSGGER